MRSRRDCKEIGKGSEDSMNAQEIIQYIASAEKKTPVKIYIKEKEAID